MSPHLLPILLAGCARDAQPPGPAVWHLVGEDGRTVIHRAVNLNDAAKRSEDQQHGLDDAELALLPEHGVTAVRLLVFWHAIEPERDAFDEAYLARVRARIEALDALGLEVVLDLHQDVYGIGFGHAGFPRWTCSEEAYASFSPPDGAWFLAYLDEAVVGCFDAFWASDALQAEYAEMTAHLVRELAHPAVTGLDVINEPYWGSLDRDVHDREVLPTFYGRVVDAVRAEDADLQLWLAPSVAANLDADPRLDLSGIDDPRVGTAPHFYPSYAELGTGFDGDFTAEDAALDSLLDHAADQGVPFFLGEYGIFSEIGGEDDYVRHVLRAVESRGGSTAYWSFDRGRELLTADGQPGPLLPVLAEPHPHRLPGRLLDWDGERVTLELVGEGALTWVAPGEGPCEATAEGALRIAGQEREPHRLTVDLEGEGEGTVALDCG